jgi:hypothetical protein
VLLEGAEDDGVHGRGGRDCCGRRGRACARGG